MNGEAAITCASRRLAVAMALLSVAACGRGEPPGTDATPASAAASSAPERALTIEEREAAVPENPLKEAYFGETHVHTSFSLDAYIGGARLTPDDAYRFAQGQTVVVNGQEHSIGRPLDWVAVSDHAEFIGEMYSTQVPGAKGGDNPMLEELRNLQTVDEQRAWYVKYVVNNMRSENPGHPPFYAGPETTRSAWQDVQLEAVRDNYQPGRFTTLAGFEWTASGTCTVMSSSGTSTSRTCRSARSTRTTRRSSGTGWPSRKRKAAACWRSRTTRTAARASCSSRSTTPASR